MKVVHRPDGSLFYFIFKSGYREILIHESLAQAERNDVTYNMNILGIWAWFTKNLRRQGNPFSWIF